MASAIKKVNMITKIVRLRQVVKRWKTKSLSRRSVLCYSASSSDTDDPAASGRLTPSGSVAVYVGPERRRFVIPTRFLNLPVFVDLLNQAEEEFGYQTAGGLTLPCETDFFVNIVRFLEEDEERFRGMGMDVFVKMFSELDLENYDPLCCTESSPSAAAAAAAAASHPFTPLLHKTRV